jgi:hypothetical protein
MSGQQELVSTKINLFSRFQVRHKSLRIATITINTQPNTAPNPENQPTTQPLRRYCALGFLTTTHREKNKTNNNETNINTPEQKFPIF